MKVGSRNERAEVGTAYPYGSGAFALRSRTAEAYEVCHFWEVMGGWEYRRTVMIESARDLTWAKLAEKAAVKIMSSKH